MKKKIKISAYLILLVLINPFNVGAKKAGTHGLFADSLKTGKTWAVVIGISKYKNRQSLKYADRDAQVFYDYLVNTGGGPKVPPLQVKMLLNEQASSIEIYGALAWLKESVKENDRVIFYFSGHGDVEKKERDQDAFLLAFNAPLAAYVTSGTVSIKKLQAYLNSFIADNQAKDVILIADACSSGAQPGGYEGIQLTRAVLGQSVNNKIIRILSAQQNEPSFEATKWGNGRGVFSYYLIKGIEGLAGNNKDSIITTKDLGTYLPYAVAGATGALQNPKIDGDPEEKLFTFNRKLLEMANHGEDASVHQYTDLGIGIQDALEPAIKTLYKKYLDFLKQGRLIWGENIADTVNCAKHFYLKLINNPRASAIQPSLYASFLTALSLKAQQILDNYVKGKKTNNDYYKAYREMDYIKSIVKPGYLLYNYITARVYYLQALYADNGRISVELNKKALQYENDAPYALNELGFEYNNINMADSAIYYLQKAIQAAPRWAYPFYSLGTVYDSKHNYAEAILNLKKAIENDSTYADAYNNLGNVYYSSKKYDAAFTCYQKAIKLDSTNAIVWDNMGIIYRDYKNDTAKAIACHKKAIELAPNFSTPYANLGYIYFAKDSFNISLNYYKKAIQLDPSDLYRYINLGHDYMYLKDFHNAISAYQKAVTLGTTLAEAYADLGYAYINNREFDKGINTLQKALKLNPNDFSDFLALAEAYSLANKPKNGLEYLKRALQKGFKDYESIITDENMTNLKRQPEFNRLMKQYFPAKVK